LGGPPGTNPVSIDYSEKMADFEDRRKVKREELIGALTCGRWDPDGAGHINIIKQAIAWVQTVNDLEIDHKSALTFLLSDIFFKAGAGGCRAAINAIRAALRDWSGQYCFDPFDPTAKERRQTWPTLNPDLGGNILKEDNPFFQEVFPARNSAQVEVSKENRRQYKLEQQRWDKARFHWTLLHIISMFCPANLGQELARYVARALKQGRELATIFIDKLNQAYELYNMCATL